MEGEGNMEELPNRMQFMTWKVEKRLVNSIASNMILPELTGLNAYIPSV